MRREQGDVRCWLARNYLVGLDTAMYMAMYSGIWARYKPRETVVVNVNKQLHVTGVGEDKASVGMEISHCAVSNTHFV